jgi:hypothetical protein
MVSSTHSFDPIDPTNAPTYLLDAVIEAAFKRIETCN